MYRQDKPYNGNGGNPLGNFKSITTNSLLSKGNDYNQAFSQNEPLIEKIDFKNRNTLLHNNVGDNVFSEYVIEYAVNVDSADRCVPVYPSPFDFKVTFKGTGGQHVVNEKNRSQDFYVPGTPGPVIERNFKQVKYIKLDYIILPKYITLDLINPGDTYALNKTISLTDYRYLIVRIKEFSSNRILSTNSKVGDDGIIIYPDKVLGDSAYSNLWITSFGTRTYTNANLGCLDRLTISILNPRGEEIAIFDNSKGTPINPNNINSTYYTTTEIASLNQIVPRIQCVIAFIVGNVGNEINTNTNYGDHF